MKYIPVGMVSDILGKVCVDTGVPARGQAVIKTAALVFSPQLLDYCKSNSCGMYNKTWTCPPACETFDEQKKRILSFDNALVFTTKFDLEDSFDFEAMTNGRELHTLLTIEFRKRLDGIPGFPACLFGAGSCPVCKPCAFPEPCPFPEKRIGSIEAAGINVTELSKAAGIAYNNGPNTVTYFSMCVF
uniref:Metal-binding protein n=1 Tax=uncultured bacterium contig00027 TaxID=1181516 RepID=A0A806KFR4_9BACT|nr:hypothetical protein [uncultured bacterium contig00027]